MGPFFNGNKNKLGLDGSGKKYWELLCLESHEKQRKLPACINICHNYIYLGSLGRKFDSWCFKLKNTILRMDRHSLST